MRLGQLRRLLRSSPVFDGLRPQKARRPLDWEENHRWYLVVGLMTPAVALGGGNLLLTGRWWERPLGFVLLVAGSVLTFGLLQWLRRPVDPEALASLRRRQKARGRFGGLKMRRPPRFPPGSPNSTQLPPSRQEE